MQVSGIDDYDDRDDGDVSDVNVNGFAVPAAAAAVALRDQEHVHYQTVKVNNQHFVHDFHVMNDDDDDDSLAVTVDGR